MLRLVRPTWTKTTTHITKPLSVQTWWRHPVQEHNYCKQNMIIKRDRFVSISQNEKNVPLTKTALRALFVWKKKGKWSVIYYCCLTESSVNFDPLKDNLSVRSSPGAHLTWTALKLSIRPKWAPKFWEIYGQANKKWKKNPEKKKAQHIILECVKPQFSDDGVCKSCMVLGRGFILSAATRRLYGVATPVPMFTTVLWPATRPWRLSYLSNNKLMKPEFQHEFSCGLEGQHWGWSYGCVRIWWEYESSADNTECGNKRERVGDMYRWV